MVLAAPVWHYWIAVVLVLLGVVPATVGMLGLFLKRTQAPKYGGDE